MDPLVILLAGVLPWLLIFAGSVYLIHLWKKPGPEQLHRAEVDELREQVSLMRDFVRDAMERINRLESKIDASRRLESGDAASSSPTAEPGDSASDPPGP